MSLSALPNELLDQICSYLEQRQPFEPFHVGEFRLANKNFAAIGRRHFPSELTVFISPESISRILTLSADSDLWDGVKSLNLSTSIYLPFSKNELIRRKGLEDEHAQSFVSGLLADSTYASIRSTQQQLLKSNHYSHFLELLLSRSTNLQSVTISKDHTPKYGPYGRKPPHMAPGFHEKFLRLYRADYTRQQEVELQVLQSLVTVFRKLEHDEGYKLTLHCADCLVWFHALSPTLDFWQDGLDNVSILKATLPGPGDFAHVTNYAGIYRPHGLVPFIRATRNIEELNLQLRWNVDTSSIFNREPRWPHLRKMTLSESNISTEHMFDFLDYHGPSLKFLSLEGCLLDSDDIPIKWLRFFERLRREFLDSLESFRFRDTCAPFSIQERVWREKFPDLIHLDRAVRYLMCGKQTSMEDAVDEVALRPYGWEEISWQTVENDCKIAMQRSHEVWA